MDVAGKHSPETTDMAGPKHVAIIMDGNGRWATRRGMPRLSGHRRGVDRVREVVKACPDLGVHCLTLFAFSTENWKRSPDEVNGLMTLFRRYLTKESARLVSEGVRVRFLGERTRLPEDIQRMIDGLEAQSFENDRFFLNVALNYGGRDEITRAAQRLAERVAAGEIKPEDVNEALLESHLDTAGVPDPCLVIRTSGEMRVSNFLLWQTAYSEFVFAEECWPDFTAEAFTNIVQSFGTRERRFGAAAG